MKTSIVSRIISGKASPLRRTHLLSQRLHGRVMPLQVKQPEPETAANISLDVFFRRWLDYGKNSKPFNYDLSRPVDYVGLMNLRERERNWRADVMRELFTWPDGHYKFVRKPYCGSYLTVQGIPAEHHRYDDLFRQTYVKSDTSDVSLEMAKNYKFPVYMGYDPGAEVKPGAWWCPGGRRYGKSDMSRMIAAMMDYKIDKVIGP